MLQETLAAIAIAPMAGTQRIAIRPYPEEIEESIDWKAKCCCCVRSGRKMRPSMLSSLTRGGAFPPVIASAWLTACSVGVLDADRLWSRTCLHCHLLRRGRRRPLGVAWAVVDPDNVSAELAVAARSGLTNKGLGALLTHTLLRCC